VSDPLLPKEDLPVILVTGATGFIGRNFIEVARDHFLIIGVGRRSMKAAGLDPHANIRWWILDISDWDALEDHVQEQLRDGRKVDFVLHLAGFYDFSNEERPEYESTNVQGTRNMLRAARMLEPRRFIFASSLAVSDYGRAGQVLDEHAMPDATFPYARSKRKGEELTRTFSQFFPCSVVRMAAVFSDWCEYGPLYVFLTTWFSRSWNARLLGGRGRSSITYIHINQLIPFYLAILAHTDQLKPFDTYVASSARAYSHKELHRHATHYYFGRSKRSVGIPKPLAAVGIVVRDWLGRLLGRRPFERPWMISYIDAEMRVDPTYTRSVVPAAWRKRYCMERRLAFLVEHLKSYPDEWHTRNRAAMRRIGDRPRLRITNVMFARKDEIVAMVADHILSADDPERFPHYRVIDPAELRSYIDLLYTLLMSSVRSGDRLSMLGYARHTAKVRARAGFPAEELCGAFLVTAEVMVETLREDPQLGGLTPLLRDWILLTMELAADEVEDAYEVEEMFNSRDAPAGDLEES